MEALMINKYNFVWVVVLVHSLMLRQSRKLIFREGTLDVKWQSREWGMRKGFISRLCVLDKVVNSQLQCKSKNPTWWLMAIFPKWLGIFQPNFTHPLFVPIYAWLRIFIHLSATMTKLCHIKRDHPVHIMCAKCAPSAKTHFLTFSQIVNNF